jgi:hypothetical protein
MYKTLQRTVAAIAGSMVLAVGGGIASAASASASGQSTTVASVQAWKKVYIHHNGSLTVTAGVRCEPGWTSSELNMLVGQGVSNSGEGTTSTNVPCDNRWHPVRFLTTVTNGSLHDGPVTIDSTFTVINNETGDPFFAKDHRSGRILHGHPAAT